MRLFWGNMEVRSPFLSLSSIPGGVRKKDANRSESRSSCDDEPNALHSSRLVLPPNVYGAWQGDAPGRRMGGGTAGNRRRKEGGLAGSGTTGPVRRNVHTDGDGLESSVQLFHEHFGFYDDARSQRGREHGDLQVVPLHAREPTDYEGLQINPLGCAVRPHVHGERGRMVRVGPERKAPALCNFVGGEQDESAGPFQGPDLLEIPDLGQEVLVPLFAGQGPGSVELFLAQSIGHLSNRSGQRVESDQGSGIGRHRSLTTAPVIICRIFRIVKESDSGADYSLPLMKNDNPRSRSFLFRAEP